MGDDFTTEKQGENPIKKRYATNSNKKHYTLNETVQYKIMVSVKKWHQNVVQNYVHKQINRKWNPSMHTKLTF